MATVTVQLNLPQDVYDYISIRAAIDDLRPADGISLFLTEIARASQKEREGVIFGRLCRICGGVHLCKGLCSRCYNLSIRDMDDDAIREHIARDDYKTRSAGISEGRRGIRKN